MRAALVWIAGAAAAIVMPWPASAAKDDISFLWCDGYSTPSPSDDQIFGRPFKPSSFGETGDKACDVALADPRLLATMWVRRAHLYQYKALHRLVLDDAAGALAQLDLSDRVMAGHPDPWFDGSLGVANQLVRGFALYRLDRRVEARAALDAAVTARPYAASVAGLARSIEMQFDDDVAAATRSLTRDVPLAPSAIRLLFLLAIDGGDFAAVERLGGQIAFSRPEDHGDWNVIAGPSLDDPQKQRAYIAGARAYANAALGKPDEASRIIAAARNMVASSTGSSEVENWARAIDVRRKVTGLSFAAATDILAQNRANDLDALTDILRQIKPANDTERAAVASAIDRQVRVRNLARRQAFGLTLGDLIAVLPEPEVRAGRPKIKREGGFPFRGSVNNGFAVSTDDPSGLVRIRFGKTVGSRAAVEEAALIEAALYTQAQGKDAFLVDWAETIVRKIPFSGREGGTVDVGFEAQMTVRPVASAALPPDLEPIRWRLVRADAVLANLASKYAVKMPAR